jgi:hypothetical protein
MMRSAQVHARVPIPQAGAIPDRRTTASWIESESLLAADVGGAKTRVALFDVVEGEYRFIAAGSAPSTAEAPFRDMSEGVRNAIVDLQSVTGRDLLDAGRQLITPGRPDGSGVDAFVATVSAGPALKTAIIGLLPDVSLESARRLAETGYTWIVDQAGVLDPRQPDQRIDALLRLQPDLVLIAGGTDGGASRSVRKMLEPTGISSFLVTPERQPAVLFAGNQKLDGEVKSLMGRVASSVHISPNVRPSLETEDLEPAARDLADVCLGVRRRTLSGMDVLDAWSGGRVLPSAYAEGRMLRFLGKVYGGSRGGVLCVDLGSSAAVVAAGFPERTVLKVYPQFGLGESLPRLLQYASLEEILRWSPIEISTGQLRDYLFQKSLYPSSISVSREDQMVGRAVTRQALDLAIRSALRDFPRQGRTGGIPPFEPIIASGGALADGATSGQNMLLLLDAIQPAGIATVILDRRGLLPMLGAAAARNSILPIQVLESGAFQSLGTAVSILGAGPGDKVVAVARLTAENGAEAQAEIKGGRLQTLPLPQGQTGRLVLNPRQGANVGFGPGRSGSVTISGGTLGVVFDARGRPLRLPGDPGQRREILARWLLSLGG